MSPPRIKRSSRKTSNVDSALRPPVTLRSTQFTTGCSATAKKTATTIHTRTRLTSRTASSSNNAPRSITIAVAMVRTGTGGRACVPLGSSCDTRTPSRVGRYADRLIFSGDAMPPVPTRAVVDRGVPGSRSAVGYFVRDHQRDPVEQLLERLLELDRRLVLRERVAEALDRGVVLEPGSAGLLLVLEHVQRTHVGAVRRDLQEEVSEQEARERAVRADRAVVVEPLLLEAAEERLHPVEAAQGRPQPGRLGGTRSNQWEGLGVAQGDAAHAVRQAHEEVLPAVTRLLEDVVVVVHLADDLLDHPIQQRLATGDVAVQRHGLDVEPLPEPPHRQTGPALLVDEGKGGGDDAGLAQGHSRRWRLTTGHHLGIRVHQVVRHSVSTGTQ